MPETNEPESGYDDDDGGERIHLHHPAMFTVLRNVYVRSAKVLPLPGVFDQRDFKRVNKDLGKCDLCGEGKAVFSSEKLRTNICEGCFGRLLREDFRGR